MAFQPRTPRGVDQYVPPPSLKAVVKGTQAAGSSFSSSTDVGGGWSESKQMHLLALANAESKQAPRVATLPVVASVNIPSPAFVPSSAPVIKPLNTPASVILERLRARHSTFLSDGGDDKESDPVTRTPAAAPTTSSAMSKSERLAFLKNAALVASRRVLSGEKSLNAPVNSTATGELTPRTIAKQIATPAIVRKAAVVLLAGESPQSTPGVTPSKVWAIVVNMCVIVHAWRVR
jgi:hypothetical protein